MGFVYYPAEIGVLALHCSAFGEATQWGAGCLITAWQGTRLGFPSACAAGGTTVFSVMFGSSTAGVVYMFGLVRCPFSGPRARENRCLLLSLFACFWGCFLTADFSHCKSGMDARGKEKSQVTNCVPFPEVHTCAAFSAPVSLLMLGSHGGSRVSGCTLRK